MDTNPCIAACRKIKKKKHRAKTRSIRRQRTPYIYGRTRKPFVSRNVHVEPVFDPIEKKNVHGYDFIYSLLQFTNPTKFGIVCFC